MTQDDTDTRWDDIRVGGPKTLLDDLLLAQQACERPERDFTWIKTLKCLAIQNTTSILGEKSPARVKLLTTHLPHDDDFVVVSYPWEASPYENETAGSYIIVDSRIGKSRPSTVRDEVLCRVLAYSAYRSQSKFWIDRECVKQDFRNPKEKKRKEQTIQIMDVLYRRSNYPIGLLSTRIKKQDDMIMLAELLRGHFIRYPDNKSGPQLVSSTNHERYGRLIEFLFWLASDVWWSRRWIFQEEYCATGDGRMHLLIPFQPPCTVSETQDVFGSLPNELVVNAATLREQATLFCLVWRRESSNDDVNLRQRCGKVLDKLRSYRSWQEYNRVVKNKISDQPMSVQILADLCQRKGSNPSDTLAIMANCSGYPRRMQVAILQKLHVHSLSVALFALLLLNGEIFHNDFQFTQGTINKYAKTHCMRDIRSPFADHNLTFMKRCRFINVRLSRMGLKTTGYIWESHSTFKPTYCGMENCRELTFRGSRCVENFINELATIYPEFAIEIRKYLASAYSSDGNCDHPYHTINAMLNVVVGHAHHGRQLTVAHLQRQPTRYALFVSEPNDPEPFRWIFTATETADQRQDRPRSRFLDKFVSIKVERERSSNHSLPRLLTRSWVNGFWLPMDNPEDVIFPWHKSFIEPFSI